MTRFRVVDAFTDRPFSGNPAAVVVLDGPCDDRWAQQVAAEFNLSETAFLTPDGGAGADYGLRWFTPSVEVELCGHATLAAAHALAEDGVEGPIRFSTRWSGVLTVERRLGRLWMDFPAHPPQEAPVPDGLAGALGAGIVRAGTAGTGDLIVELAEESAVRGLDPVPARLGGYAERGVIVTARADEGRPYAFVSRFFATDVGVDEDPVTGSAHTVLAPYWAERLGGTAFEALQCSARGGRLSVGLPPEAPGRVHIGGSAVTVSEGHLAV
ncbi:PhzF family phenazine biosynthesis protein [Nocardiopsis suaedae]|uniref:PhzF family phenazine biosynthesis protein n=1 Tax=Nocardiopsis suaedae TaxID=3018444 RepID=A0ABT4TPX8_9ACTN|nr:PhzF family phenazine biosynthesis protein [Nocardiopsis suaedae]MDA2806420.1 PhzF family phenazine biosynthesis protein [Nocardiopsis suaedae]